MVPRNTFEAMSYFLGQTGLTPVAKLIAIRHAMSVGAAGETTMPTSEYLEFCGCTRAQLQQGLLELRNSAMLLNFTVLDEGHPEDETLLLEHIDWEDVADEAFVEHERVHDPRRIRILAKTNGKCFYCHTADAEHLDHMHPKSRGGSNADENMIGACAPCNIRKGSKTVEEYRAWLLGRVNERGIVLFLGEVAA